MKKKWVGRLTIGLFLVAMLVIQGCLAAFADVVWEPQSDFFKRHQAECTYVDSLERVTNGPGGSVKVWQSPVSDREIETIENGEKVYVGYTYQDKSGNEWALLMRGNEGGWVPMAYLVPEPRAKSFFDKHGDEIQTSDLNFTMPEGVEKLYFYTYPASGELDGYSTVGAEESISISRTYTDQDGRLWGYIVYFRAQDGWICISDPGNDKIPVNQEDLAGAVMPPEPDVLITPEAGGNNLLIPIAILAVVICGAAVVLIRVIAKKNNK